MGMILNLDESLFLSESHIVVYFHVGEYRKDELLEAARSGNEDKIINLLNSTNVNVHAGDGRKVSNRFSNFRNKCLIKYSF